MPYPADAPTYIPKDQFMKYLDKYIEHFDIRPKYHITIESCTYDENRKCWFSVARDVATFVVVRYTTRFLIVASGENSEANIPVIPGLHDFAERLSTHPGSNLVLPTQGRKYSWLDVATPEWKSPKTLHPMVPIHPLLFVARYVCYSFCIESTNATRV